MNFEEYIESRFQELDFEDWYNSTKEHYLNKESALIDYLGCYVMSEEYKNDLVKFKDKFCGDLMADFKEDEKNARAEFGWECSSER